MQGSEPFLVRQQVRQLARLQAVVVVLRKAQVLELLQVEQAEHFMDSTKTKRTTHVTKKLILPVCVRGVIPK
jgi:hypothetical protein